MIETSNAGSASALLLPTDSVVAGEAQRERPAPANAEAWVLLGQRQLEMGQGEQAISSFRHAAELEPDVGLHWGRLGKALAAKRRYDAAESVLQHACALDPNQSVLHVALAEVLVQQNKADAAIEACQRAVALDPDNIAAAVTEALILPPIYAGTADLARWRNRFAEALQGLHERKARWLPRPHGILRADTPNFYLAYQGEDDRALQASYSDFLAALLGAAVPELQAPVGPRGDRSGKIRIGFLSSNLRYSTVGDYFGSWITDLPRDRFHVCTLFTGGVPDAQAEALAQASDEPVSIVGPAEEVARATKSLALDILVFPDVGMAVNSSLLVNLRLAPVQCAAWGHPVTTGSSFVDYFLSCGDMEPQEAAAHYLEELVLLPGLGTRYSRPPRLGKADRNRFGLPRDKRVYLCPQLLHKIHPDNDALFFDVLARDDDAVLVFFAGMTSGQRQAFLDRLAAGMKLRGLSPRQQIKVLPLLSQRDFRQVMSVSDVMLDTLHWSGGSSSLDALASGLPIVTLPGRFMRGRQSAAMLRLIGVEELIARDAEEYVEIALRVARDPVYREALSSRIREGLPRLADRSEPIEALADAFERMVRRG